jgi:hypothetical protein
VSLSPSYIYLPLPLGDRKLWLYIYDVPFDPNERRNHLFS